jgi:nitrile hydratase accessory protein
LSRHEGVTAVLCTVAPLPVDGDGPVFAAPWEAQAFAMTLALFDAGHFRWPEWVALLSGAIAAREAGGPDHGLGYYGDWMNALEVLVAAKGLTTAALLAARTASVRRAALATPHGQPIRLENDPLAAS